MILISGSTGTQLNNATSAASQEIGEVIQIGEYEYIWHSMFMCIIN